MEHPTADLLLRFALLLTTRQENRHIVRHLLTRCPTCAATLRKLWKEPPSPPIDPAAYDPALVRFEEQWRKHHARPRPAPLTLLSRL